jgi:hypothetical protein
VVLASARAVSAVPYDAVRRVLAAGPEAATRVLLGLDPASLGSTAVTTDEDAGLVAMEGEFWYRGEYHFAPDPAGSGGPGRPGGPGGPGVTVVRHDVVNVSGRSDRLVGLWQRRFLRGVEEDLAGFALALPHRVAASPYA